MVRRELSKHQRDLIVERYQSGEVYKIISKAIDIPWNTVKTVIIKWRKYGATVILPRAGHPSKIDEKMRRKLVSNIKGAAGISGKYWLCSTYDNNLPYSSNVWAYGLGWQEKHPSLARFSKNTL